MTKSEKEFGPRPSDGLCAWCKKTPTEIFFVYSEEDGALLHFHPGCRSMEWLCESCFDQASMEE